MAEVKTVYTRENVDNDWFVINPATIQQDFTKDEIFVLSKDLDRLKNPEGLISKHDEFPDAQTKYTILTFDTLDNANSAFEFLTKGMIERLHIIRKKRESVGQHIVRIFIIDDNGEIINSDWPDFSQPELD
jgi:hypothetical protein